MGDWLQSFISLDEYRQWIEKQGLRFPFNNGRFGQDEFSFEQCGNFFASFVPATPPKKTTLTSVLGLHTHFNIGLSPEYLYQQRADFHRQGDILNGEQDVFARLNKLPPVRPTHWMIQSQTCVVEQQRFSSILPAYRSTALEEGDLSILGMKPAHLRKNGAIDNLLPRILSLPPHETLEIEDDRLLVDLSQAYSLASEDLRKAEIVASLTFPGNAYFCSRMAMWLFRDVERWDDERAIK